ncbi:MAG: hypothetical protein U0794_23150 [Isosphaeraceae bacterium]
MLARLTRRALAVAVCLVVATASEACAEVRYYGLIFGSQSSPKRLKYTHTWATFIRAEGEGTDPNGYTLSLITISWLPRTLEVKVLRPWPEPGVNLDLYQTLQAMYANDENVTMWGPFVMQEQVFERARAIAGILESGLAQYRAIDGPANALVTDCIHAVSAIDPQFGRTRYPLIRIGVPASRHIARQVMMRSALDQTEGDHSWLIGRLGLDRYPIRFVSPREIPERPCLLCNCPE